MDGVQIAFTSINSALCSTCPEKQGELLFPHEMLKSVAESAALSVCFFHHPYNWFESTNARGLKRVIEGAADIVLTGHEHDHDAYVVRSYGKSQDLTYVQGDVLQSHTSPEGSGFCLYAIDLTDKKFFLQRCIWDGHLYKRSEDFDQWLPFQRNTARSRLGFNIQESFETRFLADPGAGFTNARLGKLELDDIFVPGNLNEVKRVDKNSDVIRPAISMNEVVAKTRSAHGVLVTGEEQSGKTTLLKQVFKEVLRAGSVPVFLKGPALGVQEVDSVQLMEEVLRQVRDQYTAGTEERFRQLEVSKRVLLIDDFHLVAFNSKHLDAFISACHSIAGQVFIFSHPLNILNELSGSRSSENLISSFEHFEIREFGNQLREELIERWFRLGAEGALDEGIVEPQIVRTKAQIDELLGRNLLPSYPIFILILLQQLEAQSTLSTSNGAHGYLYESLITTSLVKVDGRLELDTSYTFLAMIAEKMFVKKARSLSEDELSDSHQEFCAFTKQKLVLEKLLRPLVAAKILLIHDGKYWFRYKYCYFYFAARYLSDRLQSSDTADRLKLLTEQVYKEEYANILIFLAYLSNKDPAIINLMLARSRAIFSGARPLDFSKLDEIVREIQKEMPSPVLVDQPAKNTRLEINQGLDNKAGAQRLLAEAEAAEEEDFEELLKINSALKSIQILGQLLKNFPSSLPGATKLEIAEECYKLGLRTISMFSDFCSEQREELVALLSEWAQKERDIPEDQANTKARQLVLWLMEGFATHVIKRVSMSVGVKSLAPVYDEIVRNFPGLPTSLVDYSIKLDHFERFPVDELKRVAKVAEKELFAFLILRRLTIDHIYRFPVKIEDKQLACDKLHIELKRMNLLERNWKKN